MVREKSVDYTAELVLHDRIRTLERCLTEVLDVLPFLEGYGPAGKNKSMFIEDVEYTLNGSEVWTSHSTGKTGE